MTIGHHGIVLAAGLGQRMRPLTTTTPKPLIEVGGKALIDYAVEALIKAGVQKAVVNAHYLADQIETWAQAVIGLDVIISDERAAVLETGGGIAQALPLLGRDPFFVLNGDGFWIEDGRPALARLRSAWDDADMDCLLLVSPLAQTTGFDGPGDFTLDAAGRLARRATQSAPFAYIGGYLVHPRLFDGAPLGKFSMNQLWDKAISRGRLFGLEHKGHWFHVGTPEAIALAEQGLRRFSHGS
jgi:N-acetyl-alpha-D-muramate 1-phosphate uridylyltransferase